jgi:hypothetical protein
MLSSAETDIQLGSGSQIGTFDTRWGDYTSMSMDPIFDCSFWYTNQYLPSNGVMNWKTQIASFRFPSCVGCVGDCNRDYAVTVDETIMMTNIALGSIAITDCLRGDRNSDNMITVDEIIEAVNNALNGCPTGTTAPVGGAGPVAGPIPGSAITQDIGSASGLRGSMITIPVTITNTADMVGGAQLDLLYPTAILSNPRCVKAARLTHHSLSTSFPSSPPAAAGSTRMRALIVDLDAASTFDDGRLFRCSFTINPTAPPGTYAIFGELQNVSDSVGDILISTVSDGSVTVH